jgi:predicted transposase YdaD
LEGTDGHRTYPFVSQMRLQAREEGLEQGRQEGRAETLVEAIRTIFEQRGIEVDAASRARIESCDDAEVLNVWLRRSVVVAAASELFT